MYKWLQNTKVEDLGMLKKNKAVAKSYKQFDHMHAVYL